MRHVKLRPGTAANAAALRRLIDTAYASLGPNAAARRKSRLSGTGLTAPSLGTDENVSDIKARVENG
jgi:hypothetical protein